MTALEQARAVRGRVAPIGVIGGSSRVVEHNLYVYRRLWPMFLAGFFEPIFYLLGIGFGIGGLVGTVTVGGQEFSYSVYVAPALMASAAMNGAIFDATFGLFYQLKYAKTYEAMLASPITVGSVSLGAVGWAVLRGSLYSAVFLIVMALLGLVHSPLGILMLPAAILTGFAFASLGTACATYIRSWDDFDLMNLILLPLFLFSATFFPITVYPRAIQFVVEVSPLYRSIDLMRGLGLGQPSWSMAVDVAYLVALSSLGLGITSRRMVKRLRP